MAPRSRTGCLTCRQRKLKCSEERPVCAQCIKANRECIPSSGITFRHQQNPSMNGGDQGDGGLKSFYGYKETFDKGVTWVSIPKDLTFVHTSNPYEDEDGEEIADSTMLGQQTFPDAVNASEFRLSQDAYPAYATHGLEALSAVASQDQYSYAPPAPMGQHDPMSSHTSQNASSPQQGQASSSQNLDFILNPSSNLPPAEGNIDPRLHSHTPSSQPVVAQSPTHVRIQSFASVGGRASLRSKGFHRRATIEEPQLAFLLRDFSERAGLWMDLFDLGLYFATRVPVLAVTCPLLMYACASLSAKSLARVNGRKPVMGGQISPSQQGKMEYWPGAAPEIEDWLRKAREYYDVAVSLLRQALAGASRPPTSSLPEHATPETLSTVQQAPLPTTDSDELVAATAILCVYEFLDASGSEWSRHLDGAKSLFDIAKDRMVSFTLPQSPISIAQQATWQLGMQSDTEQQVPLQQLNPGRRAVFWNFARQDMLSAFINHTSTRLDTGDLPMWLSAGIRLTPDGHVCPSNPRHPQYLIQREMGEDMIANALVWLILKLVNFIAAGDEVPGALSPMGLGIRQQELLEYWEGMEDQLFSWYEGLPDSFHATVTRMHEPTYNITEKWFPRPMCASAMQSYHFAQIQLLHNKPHVTTANPAPQFGMSPSAPGTSLATRHASYSDILQRSRMHAKEIVAIGLARSDEGTRINSVQALWTAGLVLGNDHAPGENGEVGDETKTWRRTIIGLLRGIEWDLGWASEYRVQSLLELWELPPEWPATSMDER